MKKSWYIPCRIGGQTCLSDIRNNIKTKIIIMKKIAILALTAAAFVSCQQQQQQQTPPQEIVTPQPVEVVKGK